MFKNRWIRFVVIFVFVLIVNRFVRSSFQTHEDSPETAAVRQAVIQQVGCDNAQVSLIQGSGLFVTVFNPPWDNLSPDDQTAKMREAALDSYRAYPLREQLTMVDINYEKRTDYLVVVLPKFVTSASFRPKDLVPVDPLATPGPDATPTPGS